MDFLFVSFYNHIRFAVYFNHIQFSGLPSSELVVFFLLIIVTSFGTHLLPVLMDCHVLLARLLLLLLSAMLISFCTCRRLHYEIKP